MERLDDSEIEHRLTDLEGWERTGEAICKEYDRGNFVGSVDFVRSIVAPAEELGHHPDVSISWDHVTLTVTTHSEGGLTEADFELAGRIDELA